MNSPTHRPQQQEQQQYPLYNKQPLKILAMLRQVDK